MKRLHVQWIYKGRLTKALLHVFDRTNNNIVHTQKISVKLAQLLIGCGVNHSS